MTKNSVKFSQADYSLEIYYDGPEFNCEISDPDYIGDSGSRLSDPVVSRIIHGAKKLFQERQGISICHLTKNTDKWIKDNLYMVALYASNDAKRSNEELSKAKINFASTVMDAFIVFFTALDDGILPPLAEEMAYAELQTKIRRHAKMAIELDGIDRHFEQLLEKTEK